MTDLGIAHVRIRPIHPGEGLVLRQPRLRALADAPEAFSTLARAETRPAGFWQARAEAASA